MPPPPPPIIQALVERFQRNIEAYRTQGYNETQLRREFLDPFFEALGWDVSNKDGHAEAYKDVIHEDAIKIGGFTKAPDYCFRIGGTRKFFLEAKKPSVNLKDDINPAYQLRRYAWSAKLPLSILTDFEEFAVYDSRTKPKPNDKASTGRILYLTYQEYLDRWHEIASVFSKDAILKGSFDKYAKTDRKRGTATVDKEFLAEIESWRDSLARHIAIRNPALTVHDLNFSVQRTIDRLIFLRICEDRGVEHYGQLQALLNGTNTYGRLCALYNQADDRYNSGLFHFHKEKGRSEAPDTLTPQLIIDDKVLKDILRRFYYPESPYEFSVFPAEILGQVYEQFLGKVIRLTSGHQAKIEEKPEVKKAGGVYYTPSYIVDYIVKQTVGKLCEGKPPKHIAKLRILDPACGSGSFLIGAFSYLLTYHRDWYEQDGPEKHRKELFQSLSGEWRLTTKEKKRILLNNIYGVDIDSQAVEVTKLSLLLKVLEGESEETLKRQLSFIGERALPDLGHNIKCGNSLIGPDYFSGTLLPDEDEIRRVNPFDWNTEFHEIMKGGGFDAVIGNPPYVRQESLSNFKKYLSLHYDAFNGVADLYTYFIEKSLKLLREDGLHSFIVSSSFLRTTYGEQLRNTVKKYAAVLSILDFGGLPVFENAKDTYVCIPLVSKMAQPERVHISRIPSLEIGNLFDYVKHHSFFIPQERLSAESWGLKSDEEAAVFEKIMRVGKPLSSQVKGKFFRGVTTGLNDAFLIDSATRADLIMKDKFCSELIKPMLGGQNIRRYSIEKSGVWLIFTRRGIDINRYPSILGHLEKWKAELTPKKSTKDKVGRKPGRYQWYEIQDDVAYYQIFDSPKIIFPDICKGPRFFLDFSKSYLANTAYALGSEDLYLLGILNSQLFWFAISNISIPFGIRAGQYRYRLIYQYMEKVPIRVINSDKEEERAKHKAMKEQVQRMLDLHKRLTETSNPNDITRLQRQIDATDREINRLVYDLYELTEEEIAIVEGTSVASTDEACENDDHENETLSNAGSQRPRRQADPVATAARHAPEGRRSTPAGDARPGAPVHGVREPTRDYGSAPDPSEESTHQLGSTRYFSTSEGTLSYSQVSERIAVKLASILEGLLQVSPNHLTFSPEWICTQHKALAGDLFPEWAGRYRDINLQVGSHTPPPFYEVPTFMRLFCDDLSERLRHFTIGQATPSELAALLAWVDWRFQWIHPFQDFNGRIGRVLLGALLYKLALPHVETAPLDPHTRQAYLDALRTADNGDLEPLTDLWLLRLDAAL